MFGLEWKAVGGLFKTAWVQIVIAAIGIILLFAFAKGVDAGKKQRDLDAANSQLEEQQRQADANEQSGNDRVNDERELRDDEEELEDARNQNGDTPGVRALRRRCLILQQQASSSGYGPAPATCCRFESYTRAASADDRARGKCSWRAD